MSDLLKCQLQPTLVKVMPSSVLSSSVRWARSPLSRGSTVNTASNTSSSTVFMLLVTSSVIMMTTFRVVCTLFKECANVRAPTA